MGGRNFEKDNRRRTVSDHGYEHFKGGLPITGRPRKRTSKEQLRLGLDDAMAAVTQIKRLLRCDGCSHQFLALQPIDPPFPPAECPKCGGDV